MEHKKDKPETSAHPEVDPAKLRKPTTGEKYYEAFQFLSGKVFIIAISAVLAFAAHPKYGPERFGPLPNFLKRGQKWFHNKLLTNKIYPMGEKGEFMERLAGATTNVVILSHGGNLFAPFIKWMENHKEDISNIFNKHLGKPDEVEIAHERLKDEPKQSWADVIKGRLTGYVLLTTAVIFADRILGKNKAGIHRLDHYEDWFGRKVAGLTKGGKEIAATPIGKPLTEAQKANHSYHFGKIIALDLYTTSAGLILWSAVSRFFAKKRHDQQKDYASYSPAKESVITDTSAEHGVSSETADEQAKIASAIDNPESTGQQSAPSFKKTPVASHGNYTDLIASRQDMSSIARGAVA